MKELDFEVPEHVYETVRDLLAEAVKTAKPVVKEISKTKVVIAVPLTLEERITNIEGFLSAVILTN
jgi:hypothetical protein